MTKLEKQEPVAWFPLLGTGLAIRRELLNEQTAQSNHYQSLDTLASRGGLSPDEAIAVVNRREWRREKTVKALRELAEATKNLHPTPTVPWEWMRLLEMAEAEPNATPRLINACRSVRIMFAAPKPEDV